MGTLIVRLFGGLVLERDQHRLKPPETQKATKLLAYLLTAYDRSHARSLLAGLFWGEFEEAKARHNLSDALLRIRQRLERDAQGQLLPLTSPQALFLSEGDTLRLNPDAPLDLDVRTFKQLQRGPASLAALEQAIALYQGDLLEGYYDDWVLLERESLRQMYLGCLRRLLATYKAQGAWEEALRIAQRLVQAEPLEEEVTRELMRLYYRLGRRDRALQQFSALKKLLASEMEIEPDADTVNLYQLMQASQLPSGAESIAAGGTTGAGPALTGPPVAGGLTSQAMSTLRSNARTIHLVGRGAELAKLTAWLDSARPHPPMLLIQGEAGVGKSRLTEAAIEEAHRRRMFVLRGHYQHLAAPLPYAGLVDALRVGLQLGGVPPLEPLWLSEVSRLLPELAAHHPGLPPPMQLPPDQERLRLWEGLTRYLLALAATGPHMFVLEDVQWIDPTTLDLLQYALPRLRNSGAGLRLLATARSEDLAQVAGLADTLRGLEAVDILGYLPLGRLSAEAMTDLVQEMLGLPRPAPRFSTLLWQETEGNPFFALELIRFWTERGALRMDSDGDWHVQNDDLDALLVPTSITRVLEQRLGRLSPAARALIELGAVIGRTVPEHLLVRSSGSTLDAVLGPAEELLRHQLWIEAEDGHGYEFAHLKVVEVAYAGISRLRRRNFHSLVATALEGEAQPAPARLGYHWRAAENPARALPYLQAAATQAAATFANQEALVFYNQAMAAVEALEKQPPTPESPFPFDQAYLALAGRADMHIRLGHAEPAAADLERLVALAHKAGLPGRITDALTRRSAQAITQGRFADGLADLNAALDLARHHQRVGIMYGIQYQLTRLHYYSGNIAAALVSGQQALDSAREAGDLRSEVEALSLLGVALGTAGDRDQAVAILEEALNKVQELPNSLPLEASLGNNLAIFVPSPQTAYNLFLRAVEIAEATGRRDMEESAHLNAAEVLTRFGRPAAALDHLDRACELVEGSGDMHTLGMLLTTRGQVRAQLGDAAAARADLQEALRLLDKLGARYESMAGLHDLGDFLLDQTDYKRGLAHIEQSEALWQELGRPEGAYRAARYAAQRARGLVGLRRIGAARRAGHQALALLAEARQHLASWTDPSVEILAHCYAVLAAADQAAEADAILSQAHDLMMEMADRCGPQLRASYLEGIHECRVLRAAWEKRHQPPTSGGPPQEAVHSNGAGVVERDSRKVAQRQAELCLMLRDAASRGEKPSEEDLARHFGVVRRTIQRDLEALHKRGAWP